MLDHVRREKTVAELVEWRKQHQYAGENCNNDTEQAPRVIGVIMRLPYSSTDK
jgi:hypothetical protein